MTERGGDDLFFAAAAEAAVHSGTVVPLDEKKLDDDSIDVPTTDNHNGHNADGYIVPTDEEMETLRHVADYINWSTYRAC